MEKKILIILALTFTGLSANSYTHSLGLKQQQLQAFKYHHKAAVKGHRDAQYQLALMFHYGLGVRQNAALARIWFKRAAKRNHTGAKSILYRFYGEKRPQYGSTRYLRYSMNYRR